MNSAMLFHLSEQPGIQRFEPRPSPYTDAPVVWATDADHLHNYLLPRDCPRVTYYAGPETSAMGVERFLGSSLAVVAVESAWLERIRACRLFCYNLPPDSFECLDECAGYFVSGRTVVPLQVHIVEDVPASLLGRGIELRFLQNLWPFRETVVSTTLQFSFIRMRNASPNPTRSVKTGE